MVTGLFLIFLPNKFIFKQVQIHGLNYRADTSSVSSVCNLTRRIFCVAGEQGRGGDVTANYFWPVCQLEFKDLCVRTRHKPIWMAQQFHSANIERVQVEC